MQKLLTFFFSKTISVYAIFNELSFNDTFTNDIVSFEELGPDLLPSCAQPSICAVCPSLFTLALCGLGELRSLPVSLHGHILYYFT